MPGTAPRRRPLTELAKKSDGKYPANIVAGVLKFGSGGGANPAHGSAQMPVWGLRLLSLDKYRDSVLQQRISDIVTYIETRGSAGCGLR